MSESNTHNPRYRLVIELDAGTDPVEGSVIPAGGPRREFTGYVELISAVEGFRPGAAGATEQEADR